MTTYVKELEKALDGATKKAAETPTAMTRQQLVEAILQISTELMGPMPNFLRLELCAERQELRARLTKLEAA